MASNEIKLSIIQAIQSENIELLVVILCQLRKTNYNIDSLLSNKDRYDMTCLDYAIQTQNRKTISILNYFDNFNSTHNNPHMSIKQSKSICNLKFFEDILLYLIQSTLTYSQFIKRIAPRLYISVTNYIIYMKKHQTNTGGEILSYFCSIFSMTIAMLITSCIIVDIFSNNALLKSYISLLYATVCSIIAQTSIVILMYRIQTIDPGIILTTNTGTTDRLIGLLEGTSSSMEDMSLLYTDTLRTYENNANDIYTHDSSNRNNVYSKQSTEIYNDNTYSSAYEYGLYLIWQHYSQQQPSYTPHTNNNTHTHTNILSNTNTNVHTTSHTNIHSNTNTNIHSNTNTNVHTTTHTNIHSNTHTNVHTTTHTNVHTHTTHANPSELCCHICRNIRPYRSGHSVVTHRCIRVYDHFCSYLYCDIGRNNYNIFILILFIMLSIAMPSVIYIIYTYLYLFYILNDINDKGKNYDHLQTIYKLSEIYTYIIQSVYTTNTTNTLNITYLYKISYICLYSFLCWTCIMYIYLLCIWGIHVYMMCYGVTSREFSNIYSNSNRIQYTYNTLISRIRTSPSSTSTSTWSYYIRGGVRNILTRIFPPQKLVMNTTTITITSRVERDISYESNRVYIDDCYTVEELRAYIRSPHNYDLYSKCRSDNSRDRDSNRLMYIWGCIRRRLFMY